MLTNQVFKFVSVRPPERTASGRASGELPPITIDRPTRLLRAVAGLSGRPQARAEAARIARDFLASDRYVPASPEAAPLVQRIAAVASVLRRLPGVAEGAQVAAAIEEATGETPAQIVASEGFASFEEDLWDSVYAHALALRERPGDRDALFQALRATHLLRLAAGQELPGAHWPSIGSGLRHL